MKITPAVIRYFRTAPLPTIQPKNANRRTDKGENLLSIRFANYLREMTLTGKCNAAWTKVAHETSSHSHSFGNLMRNMGKMTGVPDFVFTWQGKVLWLELKDGKKGKLSEGQQFFKDWCLETKSPWEIAYSYEEAIKIVADYGITKP